jgi:hypothetical protein
MELVIDEPIAKPVTEEIVREYELQTKITLPDSYRKFLLTHNGGHPDPFFIDLPHEDDFPAEFQFFYGLDADKWFCDAWTKFKFFDTWIPFGLLMFGVLSSECSDLCFDFRRYPGASIYARLRRFVFGGELLDPAKESIPVKFFDWRYFNETRKFREKDLVFVAPDFEEFIEKFRALTPTEESKIRELMPEPDPAEIARAQRQLAEMEAKAEDWRSEANRPPRLAILAQKRLTAQRG